MNKSVLHVLHSIQYSGAEKMLYLAARQFQASGVCLNALSTDKDIGDYVDVLKSSGFKIYHLPMTKILFFHLIHFYKLLRKEHFNVVHDHTEHYSFWYLLIARMAGVDVIIRTVHSVFLLKGIARFKRMFYRYWARKCLGVIYTSIGPSVQRIEHLHLNNPTVYIPNWIDREKFFPALDVDKSIFRTKLNLNTSSDYIISVGACAEIKNHKDILQSVKILIERGLNVNYLHLGDGPTNTYEKNYAVELGIEDRVMFVGQVENVIDYLHSSDIFVMTSRVEGLPISMLESLSCGIPVVAYNSLGVIDLVCDGSNGLITDSTPEMLAQGIMSLLKDKDKLSEMSRGAVKFIDENYDMKRSVDKFLNLYGIINNEALL